MNIKTKSWKGHEIRFVEVEPGDWWAVLADIGTALDLKAKHIKERLDDEVVSTDLIPDTLGRKQEMLIVNEFGIYEAIFESRKTETKPFKRWVYTMIKELRQASGLEGYQIFKVMDASHQKEMMNLLKETTQSNKPLNYVKANTIANKAVSTKYGHPKMVRKGDMTPEMLKDRQYILEDTVRLMGMVNEFSLDVKVSEKIYEKYTR